MFTNMEKYVKVTYVKPKPSRKAASEMLVDKLVFIG